MKKYWITNDGKNWTIKATLSSAIGVANQIKGQVFEMAGKKTMDSMELVYSYGDTLTP